MGWGDEIMVTGEARRVQEADSHGRPVAVTGREGGYRWSPLWRGNPRILSPARAMATDPDAFIRLKNGPGCRPYIDYARMETEFEALFPGRPFTTKVLDHRLPWRFTPWRATLGELDSLPGVRERKIDAGTYIVVEPHLKSKASPNKRWPWEQWQRLVDLCRIKAHPWVQLGPPGTRILHGVAHVPDAGFVEGVGILAGARAAVLPEGGLHHAAAALGVPSVVIFGGMTSPADTGYDTQLNLFVPDENGEACGQRVNCAHCRRAFTEITPEIVAGQLNRLLQ